MEKKISSIDFKIRISKCKNRINKLIDQGFIFSNKIGQDLELLQNNIKKSSLKNKIEGNKRLIFSTIIVLLSIIVVYYLFFSHPLDDSHQYNLMDIQFTNIRNGSIISNNYQINGTAYHSNGNNFFVQVSSNEGNNWKNAKGVLDNSTGILLWNYSLSNDNLDEGKKYYLFFRASDGKIFSKIKIIEIEIQSSPVIKPIISINNPINGSSKLNGIIEINGTAITSNGEIKNVEIKFNEGPWENVSGNSSWYRYWDTREYSDSDYYIKLRCNDTLTTSSIYYIFVNVENPPPTKPFYVPDIPTGGKFQIYFPPNQVYVKPGMTYEVPGIHRKISSELFNTYTLLEVSHKPDWLDIIINDKYFTTPPDGNVYNISLNISINDDDNNEIMNKQHVFTISAYSGKSKLIVFSDLIKYTKPIELDVYFVTGFW